MTEAKEMVKHAMRSIGERRYSKEERKELLAISLFYIQVREYRTRRVSVSRKKLLDLLLDFLSSIDLI
jgi:hypothetical protein